MLKNSEKVFVAKRFVLILLLLALTSCVTKPQIQAQKNSTQALAVPEKWQALKIDGRAVSGEKIRTGLLKLFDDALLVELIEKALENNLDLALAALRMDEANIDFKIAKANLLPTVTGNIAKGRNRSSESITNSDYSASLDVIWEVDVWGRLRQQQKVQQGELQARTEDLEFARDSIAAQTMQAWFALITAKRQIEVQDARMTSLRLIQRTIKQRYREGLVSISDLNAARTRSAQAQDSKLQLQENVEQGKLQLNILLGTYPSADIISSKTLPRLLAPLPAGLPAQVLSRRPDLRAAWQLVLAADARTVVSYKLMFPRLSLTSNIGRQSAAFSQLMSTPSTWSVAGNLMAPLFDANRLRNQYWVVQKQAERAYLNYLRRSLLAFQEVENALGQESSLTDRERVLEQALHFAKRTYHSAEQDYRDGNINILNLLNAQLNQFDIESNLLSVRSARIDNRIALSLALGLGI